MTADELREYRRSKKMTQASLAEWLGGTKRSVVAWEAGQNPVPGWVEDKINLERTSLNPTSTYEVFRAAQLMAEKEGISIDEWVARLIKREVETQLPTSGSSEGSKS